MQKPIAWLLAALALAATATPVAIGQVPSFPQTVPGNTVVGRVGPQSGPTQAIPFATLNARLGNRISVKGQSGVLGDGTNDDTIGIQTAASQACGTLGTGGAGAELYFPSGFYKITTQITISCAIKVTGDGWSDDSGALLQSQVITTKTGLSGSIILPSATINGLVFVTNQSVTVRDIAVVYLTRAAAGSGLSAIKLQASGTATAPAPIAWNIGSIIDHVWVYGADINISLLNAGQYRILNSHITAHQTQGILQAGPNIPYAGTGRIGPNNVFSSGSIVSCQHIVSTSGNIHINDNAIHSCGSTNAIPPLSTAGIMFIPTLNAASNSIEPIVITGNTIEGLSNCIEFNGGTVGHNAAITQFVITGNQMWCLKNIKISPTSAPAVWVVGGTISGNFMTSQTLAGVTTSTSNIDINGATNVNISGNTFGIAPAVGTDTDAAITVGATTSNICQSSNKIIPSLNITMATTIPLCMEGAPVAIANGGTGQATAAAARGPSGLNIEGMTLHGDSIYTILTTDRTVGLNANLTASRAWTMPTAAAAGGGREICIVDTTGGIIGGFSIVVTGAGGDLIDGSGAFGMNMQFDTYCLISDGVSRWTNSKPATGVAAGSYGSSTQIPVLNIDAFGRVKSAVVTSIAPDNYLTGLGLTYVSTTTFTVAAGIATDSTNAVGLKLASALTKSTSAWAVGSGNGGLDTGSIAATTWYHVWLIYRSDTGVVDALFSTSATAPTMPTNYTHKRRIGSVRTNGSSQWTQWVQDGDLFRWLVVAPDIAATNPGTAAVTRTLSVPLGVRVRADIVVGWSASGGGDIPAAVYISDLSVTDATAVQTAAVSVMGWSSDLATMVPFSVMSNTSSQIRSRLQISTAGTVFYISTLGWLDRRGKDG